MCIVSLAPLIIITYANYYQYEEVYTKELNNQVTHCISSIKQTMEYFINERLSALTLLISEKTFDELSDTKKCAQLLSYLKKSFDGFIDLGLIDSKGSHRSYSGPYELGGKNYKNQHWFHEVSLRGIHVSDVFMGFRKFPHFVIAVKHEKDDGDFYILRATLNTEILNKKIHSHEFGTQSDVFIINREGILQTPSLFYGNILEKCELDVPPYIRKTSVKQEKDNTGNMIIFGSAYLDNSPFILIVTRRSVDFLANLLEVKIKLRWYLIFSIFLIASVILGSTAYMVRGFTKPI